MVKSAILTRKHIFRVGQNHAYTQYMTEFIGDLPAKNTVSTQYMYGSGQPYINVSSLPFLPAYLSCKIACLV